MRRGMVQADAESRSDSSNRLMRACNGAFLKWPVAKSIVAFALSGWQGRQFRATLKGSLSSLQASTLLSSFRRKSATRFRPTV